MRVFIRALLAFGIKEDEVRVMLHDNPAKEYIRNAVKRRMSMAEISKIEIRNVTDTKEPLVETYHARVPGYAQRTGKRLFLEPAYFQHGTPSLFSSSSRIHPVYFPYPWVEDDTVIIDLPSGFALDNADQPQPSAAAGNTARHDIRIAVTRDGRTLNYTRHFLFGADGRIFFPVQEYNYLKTVFDAFQERDAHTIAIKEVTLDEERHP